MTALLPSATRVAGKAADAAVAKRGRLSLGGAPAQVTLRTDGTLTATPVAGAVAMAIGMMAGRWRC